MKRLCLLMAALAACTALFAQSPTPQRATSAGFEYEFVPGDPLQARIYTLPNGLKVYMSVYKDAPRIQTMIAVRAGGKNDPATATGLAHYLEHIMFKGTYDLGTLNWPRERVLLDSIERLFEAYRKLTDPEARRAAYAHIDQVSNEASRFSIANEYDKLVSALGAKGTNAFTDNDRTVYVNDIPANELGRWLALEYERFSQVVPRLFHTELEAVYEEKNRALDNDSRKVYEAMFAPLYAPHPYGTQTVIGTVEHLKNPSITEIITYFKRHYVADNMAIVLAGDLDPDATMAEISRVWGQMPRANHRHDPLPAPHPLTGIVTREVVGPTEESVTLGFPMPGITSADAVTANLVQRLLQNGRAGLIDLNLTQRQQVLSAGTFPYLNADYGAFMCYATPRPGQGLDEAKDLVLGQLALLRKGDFPDWMLPAAVNDLRISEMRALENNSARARQLLNSFTYDLPWASQVQANETLAKLTKADVVAFANRYFTPDRYVVAYKRTGVDSAVQKVEKPRITKVSLNRDSVSAYARTWSKLPTQRLQPAFIDYRTDIARANLRSGVELLHTPNADNEIFSLYLLLDVGNGDDPKRSLAFSYLEYLGMPGMSAEALQQAMFKLGCSFSVFANDRQTYVVLSGLDANMEAALKLLETLLQHPAPDPKALRDMVEGIKQRRLNNKKSKGYIVNAAMSNYARYGLQSPFTNVLSDAQLDALTPEDLLPYVQALLQTHHKVMYYGPRSLKAMTKVLNTHHHMPASLQPAPQPRVFAERPITATEVFFVDYDMVQAEVLLTTQAGGFDAGRLPQIGLYNEYFGGAMNGIVFQELREAKGLAYSVSARMGYGPRKEQSNYVSAYIGTQADKLPEALSGMLSLLHDLPASEKAFGTAREAVMSRIESERITKMSKLFSYLNARELGLETDSRQATYAYAQSATLADIQAFQAANVKGRPYTIMVLGKRDKINFDELKKYGPVRELSLQDLFGY